LKEDILSVLKSNTGTYVSGQSLSEKLNVSRTSVWKYINALKEDGYIIESVSKKGYKLLSSPDILTYDEISPFLETRKIGRDLFHYETLDSTNDTAKLMASKPGLDGAVIISEEQTTGKGRLGRQWTSPKHKGIWMSIILKPDLEPAVVPRITHISAASVILALKELGIHALVKWPNDIILNNKKICGILTEMSGEINKIAYIVVGIGINANLNKDDIPSEISEKASSLFVETGSEADRKLIAAKVLNKFEILYNNFLSTGSIDDSIKICKENSALIGSDVRIICRQKETKAHAVDLNSKGELMVEFEDGHIEPIISGEVSIRGLNGYI